MNRFALRSRSFLAVLVLTVAFAPTVVPAATIFESGALGPTSVPRSDIANETVPGTNVSGAVFVGVRFFLDQPVITTQVGGHFVKNTGADESFFGAIVELDDENDFPDSGDLSTPDVVGSTLLAFPEPSAEVFGDLASTLDPGWHALVFGSGLFGATGSGVALRNNTDIGVPSYVANVSSQWKNLAPTDGIEFKDHRFVVLGTVVPEPASLGLILISIFCFLLRRTDCTRRCT